MKKIFLVALMTMTSTLAFGYSISAGQFSLRDLQAIFNDSRIGIMIGSEPIQSVTLVQSGVYRISSVSCSIDVVVKNHVQPDLGFIGNGTYHPKVENYINQTCAQ
jgi:hypothetical protein